MSINQSFCQSVIEWLIDRMIDRMIAVWLTEIISVNHTKQLDHQAINQSNEMSEDNIKKNKKFMLACGVRESKNCL